MISNDSSVFTASISALDTPLRDHSASNVPLSSRRAETAQQAAPASTYSATLEFRDGRYDFVIQLVSSMPPSARNDASLANKLLVWLTRISPHPLLAAAQAGGGGFDSVKESWSGEFTQEYIESMTRKTGNFKKFGVFADMLVSSLSRSNSSVHLDLLSLEDLQRLRQHKSSPFPLPKPSSNKRYLILSYMVAFDRVHYPLPLSHTSPVAEPTTLLSMVRQLQDDNLQLTNEMQSLHLHLRHEQDQRRHQNKQQHAARDFEHELAIMQEEFAMISELLISVQEEAHMWRERYNEVVRETRKTATSAKSAVSPYGQYQRTRQQSTDSRQSPRPRYSAAAPVPTSPRTRRPSNPVPHAPPGPASAGRQQSQRQPWKRDFSAERLHNNVDNKRKSADLPGYVPIRSAPLRSSGYGSSQASKSSPRRPTQPFRRFDPTEWARQRAERLQSPSLSPTRSWVPSSVSPARSSAWSPQRNARVPSSGSSPARSTTTSHRPDRSDWTPRASPVRSSGYGASPDRPYSARHAQHSPRATVPQHTSPAAARKPPTAARTPPVPVRAAPADHQTGGQRRGPSVKSLAERLNERNEDRGYPSMDDHRHKGGAAALAGGGELMDTSEIQDRLNRLAERLRKAREQMR